VRRTDVTRFEHGGFSFDYDDDDCDEVIAASHIIRRMFAAIAAAHGDDYAAEYRAWYVDTVLTPGGALAEGVDDRHDEGPVLRT